MTKDNKGRIWTAKANGGFVILNKPENSMFKLPEGVIASDMHEDMSGNLKTSVPQMIIHLLLRMVISIALMKIQIVFTCKKIFPAVSMPLHFSMMKIFC